MSINILDFQEDVVAKSKSCVIPGMDWKDVSQELYLHLHQNIHKYNAARGAGPRTFVVRIIANKIKDLAKASGRQKRFLDNHCLSLDELREQELSLGV